MVCMIQRPISLEFGEQQVCVGAGREGDMPRLLSVTCQKIFENSVLGKLKYSPDLSTVKLTGSLIFVSVYTKQQCTFGFNSICLCPPVLISVSGYLRLLFPDI